MTFKPITIPQRYYLGAAVVILATIIATMVAYPHLPSVVPVHWDAQRHVNGWGPKWSLFLYTPALMTGIMLMFVALPWLSPKRFEVNSFRPTYLYIMIVIVALLSYSQILILISGLGITVDVSRAIAGGVCLLITLLGNVMGKVRRNFYLGIRTPWTLASEHVWNATHRFAAKTLVVGGILALIGVVIGIAFWLPVTAVLISVFTPVIYSLVFYKQLERRGALS
jgi:uncharacterized membrane protein